MSLTFLCNKCRDRLNTNPQELPELCFNTYEAAHYYINNNNLDEALPRIGSAFEMAEMMTKIDRIPFNYSADALIATSELLINTLNLMNKNEEPAEIYQRTKNCLRGTGRRVSNKMKQQLSLLAKVTYGTNGHHLKLVHSRTDVVLH